MAVSYSSLIFLICFKVSYNVVESVLEKPTDVRIMVNETTETANVSWKKPVNDRIKFTFIELRSLENRRLNWTYVRSPASHIVYLDILRHCQECIVVLEFVNEIRSEKTQCRFAVSVLEIPTDVRIKINGSALTASISWKASTNMYVNWTSLELKDSNEQQLLQNTMTTTEYLIPADKLKRCEEYNIELKFCYNKAQCSKATRHKFFTPDRIFTTNIGSNTTIHWNTSLFSFYKGIGPLGNWSYFVTPSGKLKAFRNISKYSFNTNLGKTINITIHQVSKSDAGMYRTAGFTEGCAVLIVTDNPEKPQLSVTPQPAYVGDNITFTCDWIVQRWPQYVTTSQSYTYEGITGTRDGDKLMVKEATRSYKGVSVTCTATDDFGLRSSCSNVIVMDLYYGPYDVNIDPYVDTMTITENETLGPFHCLADCNPPCKIEWRSTIRNTAGVNRTEDQSTFNIINIRRDQSGKYFCKASHKVDASRFDRKYITVNVQYPSTIKEIKLNKTTHIDGKVFSYSESNSLYIFLTIDGNPNSSIYFYKNETNKSHVSYTRSGTTYTFVRSDLLCEDSGLYIIEATNGMKGSSRRLLQLDIQCTPKQVMFSRQDFVSMIGAVEHINVTIVANPKPYIEWNRRSNESWEVIELGNNKYIGHSRLTISDKRSYGQYSAKICNSLGCIAEIITIKAETNEDVSKYSMEGGVLSALVAILLISNAIFIYKFLKARRSAQHSTVTYVPDKIETTQAEYANVEGDIQGREEKDNGSNYEALGCKEKPNVYDIMQKTETAEEPEVTVYFDVN